MRTSLAVYALLVLLVMLAVTAWASGQVAIWHVPPEVARHPWFIATLFDTYFGFLWFWLWLAYREPRWPVRIAWLAGVLLLGNLAMAAYLLLQLRRLPPGARPEHLLLRAT